MPGDSPDLTREEIRELFKSDLEFIRRFNGGDGGQYSFIRLRTGDTIDLELLEKLNEIWPWENIEIESEDGDGYIKLRLAESIEDSYLYEEEPVQEDEEPVEQEQKQEPEEEPVREEEKEEDEEEESSKQKVRLAHKRHKAINSEYDYVLGNHESIDAVHDLAEKIRDSLVEEGILPENFTVEEVLEEIEKDNLDHFRGLRINEECDCPMTENGAIKHRENCEQLEKVDGVEPETGLDLETALEKDSLTVEEWDKLERDEQEQLVKNALTEEKMPTTDIMENVWGTEVESGEVEYHRVYQKIRKLVKDGEVENVGRGLYSPAETQEQDEDEEEKKHGGECRECGEKFRADDPSEVDRLVDEHYEKEHQDDDTGNEESLDSETPENENKESSSETDANKQEKENPECPHCGNEMDEAPDHIDADWLCHNDGCEDSVKEEEYEPIQKENISKQDWEDLADVYCSEIILQHLADGPKTPEELGKTIFENEEDVNGVYKIRRILRYHLNDIVGKGGDDINGEKYYLGKTVRERIQQDDPSLAQILEAQTHRKESKYKCLDCGEVYTEGNNAKAHRIEKAHFNWGTATVVEENWGSRKKKKVTQTGR